MKPLLTISPVQEKYAASFRECFDKVAKERRYLAQIEALPLERFKDFLHKNVRDDAIQFFALDGDCVVGWADIATNKGYAVAHCGWLSMGVHPDYRGAGVGTELLRACIEKAWKKGLTRIELEARADNRAAIALYTKLGFQQEALKINAMRFDGEYFDTVYMRFLKN